MPDRKPPVSALITAEHASSAVPPELRSLFGACEQVLRTHRAWDPGSRDLARDLADALDAPLLEGQVTRLLVDLNRSANHPRIFSEFSRSLPEGERCALMAAYWQPHWQAYAKTIQQLPGQVIHIACHSFTAVLDGVARTADIGLLYDPAREPERDWCRELAKGVAERLPGLRVRLNYPYRGTSNGLGQQHRRLYPADKLITMELEVNAALVERPDWGQVRARLVEAVVSQLGAEAGSR